MKLLFTALLLISFFSINAQTIKEEVYLIVEQMPRFPGCENLESKREKESCSMENFRKYIADNLQYPEEALKKEIEGRVTVRFKVKKDGKIESVKVLRDIGHGCGEEAKRIILSMNNMDEPWIPGMQSGKKVNVWYTTSILFRMDY